MTTLDPAALRLAALVESSDDAIISKSLDGTIESWNHAAERMFGYTAAEAIGRSIRTIIPPDRQEEEDEVLRRLRRGERIEHYEAVRMRKDGSRIELSLTISPIRTPDGEIIGASSIAREVGSRRHTEHEVLRLAAIVDSSDDAIVSKDLTGTITTWNRAAERMFGYTAEEVVGRSIRIIIPRDRQAEEDYVLSQVRAGIRIDHFQTVRQRKDGTLIDISLTVSPILAAGGQVIGVSKIARDVTEQKRLVQQLEETSRLKDEFLATLSHELRTPLNAIMGYAQMLQSGTMADEGRARAVELIARNSESLARLVSDILDISTIVAGKAKLKLSRCDVATVLDAAIEVVQPGIQAKRLTLVREVEKGPTDVLGDPDRLQQVFWNLLANAVKFTPAGGRITVRLWRDGSLARVAVTDTGIGIAADFLPHAFQRFRQADHSVGREVGGLGLGLAIVRHFVELHGGRVEARSPGPGLGSTFEVTLPLQSPEAGETP